MILPLRGEIWLADLDPTRGHEQAGRRPILVISDDIFNRRIESNILCDSIRSIARGRIITRWGAVNPATLEAVEDRLRILLRL